MAHYSSTYSKWYGIQQGVNFSSQSTTSESLSIGSIANRFPPLTEPVPNLPQPIYATVKSEDHITQITTLDNGLKVASENRFGQFCTIGGL